MSVKEERSLFIPLLLSGAVVLVALGLAWFVPYAECDAKGVGKYTHTPRIPHKLMTEYKSEFFEWECRQCGGTGKTTLGRLLLGLEDGVPPADAENITPLIRSYENQMKRERQF